MKHKRGIENGHNIPVETSEDLFRIARAFEYSRALHLANNIDVFTELRAGPLTAEQLSEKTKVGAEILEKLLIANAAMGLLISDGERFCNSLIADRYLVKDKPEYIGDSLWLTGGWWERYDELSRSIMEQHGDTPDSARHERFIQAMHDFAVNGEADAVAAMIDLTGRKRLLDLGGGPGTYSVYLCRKYQDLAATIFDQPQTEPIFRRIVDSYGMAERVGFVAGDFEKDNLGSGYDCALVSNILHGSDGDIIPPKVFKALVPGGLIIVRDYMLETEKNGPLAAALFNLGMGAYTEDEMYGLLTKAGFIHPVSCAESDSTIITAHKPG